MAARKANRLQVFHLLSLLRALFFFGFVDYPAVIATAIFGPFACFEISVHPHRCCKYLPDAGHREVSRVSLMETQEHLFEVEVKTGYRLYTSPSVSSLDFGRCLGCGHIRSSCESVCAVCCVMCCYGQFFVYTGIGKRECSFLIVYGFFGFPVMHHSTQMGYYLVSHLRWYNRHPLRCRCQDLRSSI